MTPECACVPPVAQQAFGDAQLMASSWPPPTAGEGASCHAPPVQCSMNGWPLVALPPTAQQSVVPGHAMASSASLGPGAATTTVRQCPAVSCFSSG